MKTRPGSTLRDQCHPNAEPLLHRWERSHIFVLQHLTDFSTHLADQTARLPQLGQELVEKDASISALRAQQASLYERVRAQEALLHEVVRSVCERESEEEKGWEGRLGAVVIQCSI